MPAPHAQHPTAPRRGVQARGGRRGGGAAVRGGEGGRRGHELW